MKLLQSMLSDIQQYLDRISLLEFYESPKKLDLDAKFHQMIETIRANEPKRYEKMSLFEILNDISHRNKVDNMKTIDRLDREKNEIDKKFDEEVKRIRNEMDEEEAQIKRIKSQLETIPKTVAEMDEKIQKLENELKILKQLESNPKYEAEIKKLNETIKQDQQTRETLINQESALKTELAKHTERLNVYRTELSRYNDEARAKAVMNLKKQIDEHEQINLQEEKALKELMLLFHKHLDNPNALRNHFENIASKLKRDDSLPSDWFNFLQERLLNALPPLDGYFTIPTKWEHSYFIPSVVSEEEKTQVFSLILALKAAFLNAANYLVAQNQVYVALPSGLMATIRFFKNPTQRTVPRLYLLKSYDENVQRYVVLSADGFKTYLETIEGVWYQGIEYSLEIKLRGAPLLMGLSTPIVGSAMAAAEKARHTENLDVERK